jgi:hypothetical protein
LFLAQFCAFGLVQRRKRAAGRSASTVFLRLPFVARDVAVTQVAHRRRCTRVAMRLNKTACFMCFFNRALRVLPATPCGSDMHRRDAGRAPAVGPGSVGKKKPCKGVDS